MKRITECEIELNKLLSPDESSKKADIESVKSVYDVYAIKNTALKELVHGQKLCFINIGNSISEMNTKIAYYTAMHKIRKAYSILINDRLLVKKDLNEIPYPIMLKIDAISESLIGQLNFFEKETSKMLDKIISYELKDYKKALNTLEELQIKNAKHLENDEGGITDLFSKADELSFSLIIPSERLKTYSIMHGVITELTGDYEGVIKRLSEDQKNMLKTNSKISLSSEAIYKMLNPIMNTEGLNELIKNDKYASVEDIYEVHPIDDENITIEEFIQKLKNMFNK